MADADIFREPGTSDGTWPQILYQITEARHLGLLGNVIPIVPKSVPKKLWDESGKFTSFTDIQVAALGLLVRVNSDSDTVLACLLRIVHSAHFARLQDYIQQAIAMKLIRAAVQFRWVRELGQKRVIQQLYSRHPETFQLPLLYLSAETRDPIDLSPKPKRQNVRYDALVAYYAGVNKLLLRRPEAADNYFIEAWILSKGAKDLRPEILRRMSLSAYLSGKAERVFLARFPRKYATNIVLRVWSLQSGYRSRISGAGDPMFTHLLPELCQEHAKRVIVDLCKSVVKLNMARLDKLVEGAAITTLTKLASTGDVVYEISRDVVTLRQPLIGPRVAVELKALQAAQQ
jgi:hypothetical protein